jgi:hypothetical protein
LLSLVHAWLSFIHASLSFVHALLWLVDASPFESDASSSLIAAQACERNASYCFTPAPSNEIGSP